MRDNFGRQPYLDVIRARGQSYAWVAREVGISYSHFLFVGRGVIAPSPEFRRRLCALLKVPQRELFTSSALATEYRPRRQGVAK
jgi:hypothetical protein